MTLEELRTIVDKKNKDIDVDFIASDGFLFCKEFVENNNLSSAEGFMNSDVYEICKCIYYIYNKDKKSMKECIDFIESYKGYFQEQDEYDFRMFVDMIYYFINLDSIEQVIEILEENNGIKARAKMRLIDFSEKDFDLTLSERAEKNSNHYKVLTELRHIKKDCNVALLLQEFQNNEAIAIILGLIEAHKKMLFEKDTFLDLLEEKSIKKKNTTGAKKKLKGFLKNNFKIKNILSELRVISKYVTEEEYRKNTHNRQIEREIKNNDKAFEVLSSAAKQAEITDARSIIKKIKDEELKNCFLKFIYNHNMKYYVELDKKLESIRSNTSTLYLDELSKHGLLSNSCDVIEFMHNNIDDFREILSIITKYRLTKIQMISILRNTTIEIVRKIDDYVRDGYLSIIYVRENVQIFNPNDDNLSIIDSNVKILDNNGINPKIFIDYPEILLMNKKLLFKNIKLLDDYQLKGCIRTTDDYHFMLDDNLEEKIDKLIELGYGEFLDNDLSLLNYTDYNRLEILKYMNIPVSSIDKMKEVLDTDKFIVDDDSLEQYIPSAVSYNEKQNFSFDLNILEENKIDRRTYLINGVIISSNKVKRLLDKGLDMYDAIFYNTNLSQDEYDAVLKMLRQYIKK